MADSVERIIRRERTWQAWVGSTADLERVGRLVGKLLDRRRDLMVEEFRQENPPPADPDKDEILSGKYMPFATYSAFAADKVGDINKACAFQASLADRNGDVTSGEFEAVLAELDVRNYRMITLKGNFGSHYLMGNEQLELQFNRDTQDPGVSVAISSPDQGWAKQALAEITEEIDKGRKWWGLLRTFWGSLATGLVAAALAAVLSTLLLTLTEWQGRTELVIQTVAAATAGIVVIAGQNLRQWFFPPVEIVGEGVTPRGSRVIFWLGGLIFSAIVAVAVNTIK